jgi:hypothetical protein
MGFRRGANRAYQNEVEWQFQIDHDRDGLYRWCLYNTCRYKRELIDAIRKSR